MTKIFNRSSEKTKRKQLRCNMPEPEVILWSRLQKSLLKGHKFRRQHGIDRYVVDFCCPKAKLVIEIDGDSHFNDESQKYDQIRSDYIQALGIKVVRFTNHEIRRNLDGVIETIEKVLCQN